MPNTKPQRLTITFNRATVKVGENFEVTLPSSEADGYEWVLKDTGGTALKTVGSRAHPAWEPRARVFTLAATQAGKIDFEIALDKAGSRRPKQVYKFKVLVK